jgi:hypothetical protein
MAGPDDPVKAAAKRVSAPKEGVLDTLLGGLSFFAKYVVLFTIGAIVFSFIIGLLDTISGSGFRNDFLGLAMFKLLLKLWRWLRNDNAADSRFKDPNVR